MAKPTADVLDEHEDALVCELPFTLRGRRRAIEGPIRTIRCFEDNALLKALLATASSGEILVIDGGDSLRTALIGDIISSSALQNGWAGVIVYGAIRDSAQIDSLDFHLKARGTNPRKSARHGAGERDVAIQFGNIRFVPGDYLYSDEDGIVVASGR